MAKQLKEEENIKVRLQRLQKTDTNKRLEYLFTDRNGTFYCYNEALQPVSQDQYKNGAKYKVRVIPKGQDYIDIFVTPHEKGILTIHPFVKWDGNPNMNNVLFELIEVAEKSNKEVKEIKKFKQVINLIDSMTIKEIYSLCNYLGLNVTELDMNDIYIMLLDRKAGVAYMNYDKVMQFEKDPDSEMVSVINRALVYGIIERQGEEYFFGGKMIAASLTELQFYCKQNEDFYNAGVLKAVMQKEVNLPITIQFKENFNEAREMLVEHQESVASATDYTEEDMEWFKERANELKIAGRWNMGREKLVEAVLSRENMRLIWEERKAKEKALRLAAKEAKS